MHTSTIHVTRPSVCWQDQPMALQSAIVLLADEHVAISYNWSRDINSGCVYIRRFVRVDGHVISRYCYQVYTCVFVKQTSNGS